MTGSWKMLLGSWKVLEIFATKRVGTLSYALREGNVAC